MIQPCYKFAIVATLVSCLASCDDNSSRAKAVIFVDSIAELDGDWLLTQELTTYNEDVVAYKTSVRTETIKITSFSDSQATLSRCDGDDVTIELTANTISQVLSVGVDEDGDGNIDQDGSGNPITEEVLNQLFVLDSPYSMVQPFTTSCDTQQEVDQTGCTLNHSSSGTDRMYLLNSDDFGSFSLDTFSTTNDPNQISTPEMLVVDCYNVFIEAETDGEGTTEAITKASNANYQLDIRHQNTIDFDPILKDFTETNKAWIQSLQQVSGGTSWQWRSADELTPNPEHNRSDNTGEIVTNNSATAISMAVENLDNNEIEEDNAGVTSTVIYNATGSGTLTFERFEEP